MSRTAKSDCKNFSSNPTNTVAPPAPKNGWVCGRMIFLIEASADLFLGRISVLVGVLFRSSPITITGLGKTGFGAIGTMGSLSIFSIVFEGAAVFSSSFDTPSWSDIAIATGCFCTAAYIMIIQNCKCICTLISRYCNAISFLRMSY